MTISTNDRRKEYPGNGVATAFAGPRAFAEGHLAVYLVADGVATLQASGYTVTGVGTTRATTVTFAEPPPDGVTVQILRTVPYEQALDLSNQGAYFPETLETGLDAIAQQVQQLDDRVSRAVQVDEAAVLPDGFSPVLPVPEGGRPIAWNADGTGLVNGDATADLLLRGDLANAASGADLVKYDATRTVKHRLDELAPEAEQAWTAKHMWGATGRFAQFDHLTTDDGPLLYLRKDAAAPTTTQYAGGSYTYIRRTGGNPWAARNTTYWVTATMTSGFDVGDTVTATARNIEGGTLLAQWHVAMTPCIADASATFGSGKVYACEMNFGNRWAEFGLLRDLNAASRLVAGLFIVPDVVQGPDGYTSASGHFNASFGLVFSKAKSGTAARRTWTLIHADDDAVPAGGLHMCMRGGSDATMEPAALLEARDYWENAIDLSNAKVSGHALILADSHTTKWGTKTQDRGTAAPTTGTWVVGSIRWNNAPASGGYIGWVCTSSGTPGTWKGFGAIAA